MMVGQVPPTLFLSRVGAFTYPLWSAFALVHHRRKWEFDRKCDDGD